MLVLVEGPAGFGKTRLVRSLTAAPWAARLPRAVWACRDAEPPALPAGGRPFLLVVEDLHRAPDRAVAWLRGVLEEAGRGLAVVVTYRPEELPEPGLPLGVPAPRYASHLAVRRHRLGPWTADQVCHVVAEALGKRCTPEAITRLHERSGGVPQVVADLVEALRDRPDQQWYTPADVDAAGVPVRLSDLVLARTAALAESHRPVVWAAAVLERPVSDRELLAVAALSAPEGRAALDAALTAGLLVEAGDGRYRLPCPLAAQAAVHDVLPGPLRKDLHGRAADVLAAGPQPVSWPELARHRRAAGRVRGWLRAVEQAAHQAQTAGYGPSHQEAIGLLEQAVASPLVPPQARARLAPVLARHAVVGLRSDETIETLRRVLRDESLPAAVRGEIRYDLGLLALDQNVLEQAVSDLREERPALAVQAMCRLAVPGWLGTPVDVHRTWLRAADKAAADSGDEAARAAVASARVTLATMSGDPEGWSLVRELPTDSAHPQVRRHAVAALCNAADSAVWLGRYDRAEELLAEGAELTATNGFAFTEHGALGAGLVLDWMLGRWAGLAERCEAFVAATSDMHIASDGRLVLGLLALSQGEWGRTVSSLSEQRVTALKYSSLGLVAAASGALIRLDLARDDIQAAVAESRTAWQRVVRKGIWADAAELAPWAVEATARAGRVREAQAMVGAFAMGIVGIDAPSASAALTWSRAVLAETTGRAARAVPLYREASTAYAALSRPYSQALTAEGAGRCALTALGDAAPRTADGAEAITELTSSIQHFTDLGAQWDATRARALLRVHSPTPERRPLGRPGYGDRLSPREREVAGLAGAGLTNREIAVTLHLSPRTVEQHVGRAMRKLNLQSRQQLPAPAADG
ncbi:LuxR family transcriptional regulator [Streptomyces sp. L2]|uniref:helix-turn-helix transcriptional regulator n=1 Tax=Streptomyces sp. L2 TaxID=2162665 RepID=UPI001012E01C|nr:LuxR family transcriptional regulator [Streptomyces sp. L2]